MEIEFDTAMLTVEPYDAYKLRTLVSGRLEGWSGPQLAKRRFQLS
jgi:hypothetical protein